MSSITQGGIAVYQFNKGTITPERFIKIPAQQLGLDKELTYEVDKNLAGTVPAYPAGFAVLGSSRGDRLLVANHED